jgi:hypothetical protein
VADSRFFILSRPYKLKTCQQCALGQADMIGRMYQQVRISGKLVRRPCSLQAYSELYTGDQDIYSVIFFGRGNPALESHVPGSQFFLV